MYYTASVCVCVCVCVCIFVALDFQHAMRVPYYLWPVLLYILPCLINGKIFKKVIEHKMCFFIFSTTFVQNISFSKKK